MAVDEDLISWAVEKQEEGFSEDQIREELLQDGYSRDVVSKVLQETSIEESFWSYLWSDMIRFEKKKLILPILALAILGLFVGSLHHLRSNEVDSKIAGNISEAVYWPTAGAYTLLLFNKSEQANETAQEYIDRSRRARDKVFIGYEKDSLMNSYFYSGVTLLSTGSAIYSTPLFPLTPPVIYEAPFTGLYSPPDYTLRLPTQDYVLSREMWTLKANIRYRFDRLNELKNEANNSIEDWSVERFDRKVRKISRDSLEEGHMEYLRNSLNRSRDVDELNSEDIRNLFGAKSEYIPGRLVELRWYHFIPTAIVALLIYYLVNGFLVTLYRESWKENKRSLKLAGLTLALYGLIVGIMSFGTRFNTVGMVMSVLSIGFGAYSFIGKRWGYKIFSLVASANILYAFLSPPTPTPFDIWFTIFTLVVLIPPTLSVYRNPRTWSN